MSHNLYLFIKEGGFRINQENNTVNYNYIPLTVLTFALGKTSSPRNLPKIGSRGKRTSF